jgi:hypothetical protein
MHDSPTANANQHFQSTVAATTTVIAGDEVVAWIEWRMLEAER